MLRWVVLVVSAHPVPPTVSVAWICGPHESARSAAQAHLNMDAFGHRHSVLPRWWRRELHTKIKNVHVQIQTKHESDARHGEQQTAIQSTNQTLSVASPTTLIGILPWAPHSPTLRRPTGCSWNCVVPRRWGGLS